jgi:hypothetical protein
MHEGRSETMRVGVRVLLAGAAALGSTTSACAMTSPAEAPIRCTVEGARSLPPEIGGEQALCEAIHHATAGAGHTAHVQVRVHSKHRMSAITTLADGRSLPVVTTSAFDRDLSVRSVRTFADAIGAQLRANRP